ncbi:MAG: ABC transporter permease [SAR324 cluster bacterium]|nr:ABC transporter permease [SAR324 cluster bacterium]
MGKSNKLSDYIIIGPIINGLAWLGDITKVTLLSLFYIFLPPYRPKIFLAQLYFIGNGSLSVILLTGSFTGMVLALQMFEVLKRFSSESMVGAVVALSLTRELGPVLSALMVNARAGSSMAAEIGTMKVTEQIMAIESMAVNSYQYLISPRIFAGILMMPALNIISNVVGVLGGYFITVSLLGLDPGLYFNKIDDFMEVRDLVNSSLKAAIFGLILTVVGSYQGFNTSGGAKGVGKATTSAVVISAVLILAFDYLLTSFMIQS